MQWAGKSGRAQATGAYAQAAPGVQYVRRCVEDSFSPQPFLARASRNDAVSASEPATWASSVRPVWVVLALSTIPTFAFGLKFCETSRIGPTNFFWYSMQILIDFRSVADAATYDECESSVMPMGIDSLSFHAIFQRLTNENNPFSAIPYIYTSIVPVNCRLLGGDPHLIP